MMGDGMCKRDRVALMAAIIYAGYQDESRESAVGSADYIDWLVRERLDGKQQKQEAGSTKERTELNERD